MKRAKNLFGTVTVPLEDVKDQVTESWHNIVKNKEEELSQSAPRESFKSTKKRGSLRIGLRVSAVAQLHHLGPHWYDALLHKLMYQHLGYLDSLDGFGRTSIRRSRQRKGIRCSNRSSKSNSTMSSSSSESSGSGSSIENEVLWPSVSPWPGTLSNASLSILKQYATMLNIPPQSVILSWWKVTSRLSIVDQSFLLQLLAILQRHIAEGNYSDEEMQEVRSTLRIWASLQEEKLVYLNNNYPATSRVISYQQLTHTLRGLKAVDSKPETRSLQIFPQDMWENAIRNRGRNSPDASEEQQLVAAVAVSQEIISFLRDVCDFYQDVFIRESQVSFLRLTYALLTYELSARVRPLMIKLYKPKGDSQFSCDANEINDTAETNSSTALQVSNPVWQLYKRLEIIVEIGENLPEEVQLQSDLHGYHQWFVGGVIRWQEHVFRESRSMIAKEVQKDEFQSNAKSYGSASISSSAMELTYVFRIVTTYWQKLAWPDEAEGNGIAKQLMQQCCSLGLLYTKLVISKLEVILQEKTDPKVLLLSAETCRALNNIEYVCEEIQELPGHFGLAIENEKYPVITNTTLKMETSIKKFIDTVIKKLRQTLNQAVMESCEMVNETPLLKKVLDQYLSLLDNCLTRPNFERFLRKIWNVLVAIFVSLVESNCDKKNAEFFSGVFTILERTWHFFTHSPTNSKGLDPQLAHTMEYQNLLDTLGNLKMPTESLVAKYYRERFEEQSQPGASLTARLVVLAYFTTTGNLTVEVIMANDIVKPKNYHEPTPVLPLMSSGKSPDTYVQVKLVPGEWFPNVRNQKTKIQKKSEAPVYKESFEFLISHTDTGTKSGGHLLFVLKMSHRVQADCILGEAVLPLEELPCVEPSAMRSVTTKYLTVNLAREDNEYTALKALQYRIWDKKAVSFLKEGKKKRKIKLQLDL
ncbi:putative protein unc-13-like D isoform X12 [Penaeus vannamei]|uniref:BAI1-associated protein 3 n=1 Tax=Penaeus vannamei TaxID=6689 RepID=A0A3R7QIK6_PENVA|nr:putative protein unc-13-like D isoform X12 [Penaeus vannamei]